MAKSKLTLKQRKFSANHLLLTAVVFGLVGGLVGWAAFAAPVNKGGGGGNGASLSLVMVTDQNGDGLPNYGDTITFNVNDSASFPSVQLDCYQNGGLVYTSVRGFYPTYSWTDNYDLKGGYWSNGAADCTATLYHTAKNGRNITDATLKFHVNA